MPRNLLHQVQKALELASGHGIDVYALCLLGEDLATFRSAGIGEAQLGVKFAPSCLNESAVCGLFRGAKVAIGLSDNPIVEPIR